MVSIRVAKPTQSIPGGSFALDDDDLEGAPARDSTDRPAETPLAGSIMGGKYRLISEIGRGGMGAVWRAEHLGWAAPVALKIMSREFTARPEALGRFEREVRLAAGLRSPHVVQVLDHGIDDATRIPFIAMELLEGETLARRLKRAQRIGPAETFVIVTHLARALTRAHAAGIIHRDLKPDNVFLVRNDEESLTKVLDFGVAKWTAPSIPEGGLTRPGSVLGTPFYMSPEQIQGARDIDHRVDLWSLSAIVCECLTGKRPFEAKDFAQLAVLLLGNTGRPLPSALGPVPPGFDAWFLRATAPDISKRFQSARELAHSLAMVCGATPPSLAPDSFPATEQLGAIPNDAPSMAAVSHTASRAFNPRRLWQRPLARLLTSTALTTVIVTSAIAFWYRNVLPKQQPGHSVASAPPPVALELATAVPALTPSVRPLNEPGTPPQSSGAPPEPTPPPAAVADDPTARPPPTAQPEPPAAPKPAARLKPRRSPSAAAPRNADRPAAADDARPTPTSKSRAASPDPPAEAATPPSLIDGRRIRTTLAPSP